MELPGTWMQQQDSLVGETDTKEGGRAVSMMPKMPRKAADPTAECLKSSPSLS